MSMGISIYLWNHHHYQGHKQIHHLPKFPLTFFLFFFLFLLFLLLLLLHLLLPISSSIVYVSLCVLEHNPPVSPSPLHLFCQTSTSPLATINLFSIFIVPILLFVCLFIVFFIPFMSRIIYYLSLSVWLISLSIIISRSIHVDSNGMISSFFLVVWCSIVYIHHIFLIH